MTHASSNLPSFFRTRRPLKAFSVQGFKAFGPRQRCPLAPLTLVFGPNSSGKSSLIEAILLLAQSLSERGGGGLLPIKGPLVDLGGLQVILHAHDRKSRIGLGFETEEQTFGLELQATGRAGDCRVHRLSMNLSTGPGLTLIPGTDWRDGRPCYQLEPSSVASWIGALTLIVHASRRHDRHSQHYEALLQVLGSDRFDKALKAAARQAAFSFNCFSAEESEHPLNIFATVPDVVDALAQSPAMDFQEFIAYDEPTKQFAETFRHSLEHVSHIGPTRLQLPRVVVPAASTATSVGTDGSKTLEVLHNGGLELQSRVGEWFQRLGLGYGIDIRQVEDDMLGMLLSLRLHILGSGTGKRKPKKAVAVTSADVGFGVGQVLPILVEGLASASEVVCVQQPEIHLHPKLQAELAEFFLATRDKKQWIVETHSEALLLRIQRRVRDGTISPDQVSVLYVHPGAGAGATVMPLRLDESGAFIDTWPTGFFDDALKEMLA